MMDLARDAYKDENEFTSLLHTIQRLRQASFFLRQQCPLCIECSNAIAHLCHSINYQGDWSGCNDTPHVRKAIAAMRAGFISIAHDLAELVFQENIYRDEMNTPKGKHRILEQFLANFSEVLKRMTKVAKQVDDFDFIDKYCANLAKNEN